ncbi:hypothetical protein Fcan01_18246 [Folsomia candida]|uniref:Uncharacterized protein n=1 Tax=Folsomia candida TaxID=158441 RepID=A0A226DPZ5_FOLCA|nr:hypothetical protein Fcan01_18246 [Folsomia candida]
MLSKTSSRLLRFFSKWTSLLGGMPFEWDNKRSKLRISEKGWAKWTFWVVFAIVNWSFYFIKLSFVIATAKRKSDPVEYIYEKVKGYQIMIIYVIYALISVNSWRHMQEIVCFVNAFIRYSQHFRNAYIKRLGRGWRNGCEVILHLLAILTAFLPILSLFLYIANPLDIRWITSFLPPTPTTPLVVYLPLCIGFGALHTGWAFSATSTITFYTVMSILPSFVTLQMMREICGGRPYYISRPLLRRPPRLCQTYRALQILIRLWNKALTSCLFPLKVSAEAFSMMGNSLLIKFHKLETPMSRLLLLLVPNVYLATWLVSLHLFGLLWKRSSATVRSWQYLRLKDDADFILLRKFRKSCAPLKIKLGKKYFVQPKRVVVTINTVVITTLKFLLAIKKKIQ